MPTRWILEGERQEVWRALGLAPTASFGRIFHQRDHDGLFRTAAELLDWTNTRLAHLNPKDAPRVNPTHDDLDTAIDRVGDIFNRYKRLLWGFDSDISHVQLRGRLDCAAVPTAGERRPDRQPQLVTTGPRHSGTLNVSPTSESGPRSDGPSARCPEPFREWARRPTHRGIRRHGEAVWWVTITDDTLITRHRHAYPAAQAALDRISPPLVSCLAGLRSVRNRIGHEVDLVDFVNLEDVRPDQFGDGRIAAWS